MWNDNIELHIFIGYYLNSVVFSVYILTKQTAFFLNWNPVPSLCISKRIAMKIHSSE